MRAGKEIAIEKDDDYANIVSKLNELPIGVWLDTIERMLDNLDKAVDRIREKREVTVPNFTKGTHLIKRKVSFSSELFNNYMNAAVTHFNTCQEPSCPECYEFAKLLVFIEHLSEQNTESYIMWLD